MNLDEIFKQDQSDAGTRAIAKSLATYYLSLVSNGIPEETATDMLLDYHWILMCSSTFKDGNYPPRS